MSWVQVSEDKILEALKFIGDTGEGDPTGAALRQTLERGSKFVLAGLTPFYILDEEQGTFFVTSQEQVDGKLH